MTTYFPNANVSNKPLPSIILLPWTETHAASPTEYKPGTIFLFPSYSKVTTYDFQLVGIPPILKLTPGVIGIG